MVLKLVNIELLKTIKTRRTHLVLNANSPSTETILLERTNLISIEIIELVHHNFFTAYLISGVNIVNKPA